VPNLSCTIGAEGLTDSQEFSRMLQQTKPLRDWPLGARHWHLKSCVKNAEIAELLAQAAEHAKQPVQRALRRAARRAFLWPEEAERNQCTTILE
jgi:hypothetical protein